MSQKTECKIEKLPENFTWPDNKKIAVVFNIAYEMWAPESPSSVNPMGNVLSGNVIDPNADSYGRYNINAGCKRLCDIAESEGVLASIFTSGMVAEQYPMRLKELAKYGHEIIGHSYAQNLLFPYLDDREQEDTIARSTQLIEQAIGHRPYGWVSPRVTSDIKTHRKLLNHGYKWHGDALDDDLPYLQRFSDGDILAVPMTVDFNDLPHAMRFGRTPEQFVQMFESTLNRLLFKNDETLILDIIVHGHCYGRPAGAWAFAEIIQRCIQEKNIWLTTRGQIANYAMDKF